MMKKVILSSLCIAILGGASATAQQRAAEKAALEKFAVEKIAIPPAIGSLQIGDIPVIINACFSQLR